MNGQINTSCAIGIPLSLINVGALHKNQWKKQMDLTDKILELSPWYHSIPLEEGGLSTPGKIKTKEKFQIFASELPSDLNGYKVLDVGCSGGGLAAEYGRCGAHVVGIEAKDHEIDQARFIFSHLGLSGEFRKDDAMNAYKYGKFDIINCCGLLYHLPYPLFFLDLLSYICTEKMVLQTRISPKTGNSMDLMKPVEGPGNWWFPTEEAVLSMIALAGFRNVKMISINKDRSNIFCVADAAPHSGENSSDFFELADRIFTKRTPTAPRIIGMSAQNDLPDRNIS